MPQKISCPHCDKPLWVIEGLAYDFLECPACFKRLPNPGAATDEASTSPEKQTGVWVDGGPEAPPRIGNDFGRLVHWHLGIVGGMLLVLAVLVAWQEMAQGRLQSMVGLLCILDVVALAAIVFFSWRYRLFQQATLARNAVCVIMAVLAYGLLALVIGMWQ